MWWRSIFLKFHFFDAYYDRNLWEKWNFILSINIYIECGLLHNTYSISAELFINFDTKTVFFLCSRCCFNNSRTPGAHVAPWPQVGCSGHWLQIFSFVRIVILRADVSNEVMTLFCVPDIAGRGCKKSILIWLIQLVLHLSLILGIVASFFVRDQDCFHRLNFVIWRIS